jgi:hypothetical protein
MLGDGGLGLVNATSSAFSTCGGGIEGEAGKGAAERIGVFGSVGVSRGGWDAGSDAPMSVRVGLA